ncbi:peptide chain release factor N(5)-glutamine methyltransferase [Anaerolinea thermophila]|uniref:Release factor glutamine methyltransferase n=1 Tax=Anaerolinea thermophila (strain DSM 14523 / JCM 11388 / NBRC 100420 / UNI-1) TaxID=926569 RepID=E8N3I3_ANATU|nr:peptide chain release factor N(5)-glutamine methyltransferase [Anaerolinea thermophila]BAJ62997.1 putative modification methylase HemK [Anaerolinea thermophila UNI-1]
MKNSPTLGAWLQQARETFAQQSDTAGIEVQVLAAHVLKRPRAWIAAHPETLLSDEQASHLNTLLGRLLEGVPLPYLTGKQEFFGLEFEVSPAVLIPRPETETLVEAALQWLKRFPERNRVADVGTGSGCIAVSIAYHMPNVRVLATDFSHEALKVAQRNVNRHGVSDRVQLIQCDLLSACAGMFDLVCANLPYIPTSALDETPPARFEPIAALDGGESGWEKIKALLQDAPRWLVPGGCILLEIQWDQGQTVSEIARGIFPAAEIQILQDLAHLDRVVLIQTTREKH